MIVIGYGILQYTLESNESQVRVIYTHTIRFTLVHASAHSPLAKCKIARTVPYLYTAKSVPEK